MAASEWDVIAEVPLDRQTTPWRTMPAAAPYLQRIAETETKYGLPEGMLGALLQRESNFDPSAVSPKGARGIAQIMPSHHPGVDYDDPLASIDYAGQYLRENFDQYGTWDKSLAAYNTGPGNLNAALSSANEGDWRENLSPETQSYVRNLSPVQQVMPTAERMPESDQWAIVEETPYAQPRRVLDEPRVSAARDSVGPISQPSLSSALAFPRDPRSPMPTPITTPPRNAGPAVRNHPLPPVPAGLETIEEVGVQARPDYGAPDYIDWFGGLMETYKQKGIRAGLGTQEYLNPRDAIRRRLTQLAVIPGVVQRSVAAKQIGTTGYGIGPEDTAVIDAAQQLGMRPIEFLSDWPQIMDMSEAERNAEIGQLVAKLRTESAEMASLQERRGEAGRAMERAHPEYPKWSLPNLAFDAATSAPELAIAAGATMAGGPLAGVGAMSLAMAPQIYADAKDHGLTDGEAEIYVALMTSAEALPEIPVLQTLFHSPQAKRFVMRQLGPRLLSAAETTGKGALGEAGSELATETLQQQIERELLGKQLTFGEAIEGDLYAAAVGAGMGTPLGGVAALREAGQERKGRKAFREYEAANQPRTLAQAQVEREAQQNFGDILARADRREREDSLTELLFGQHRDEFLRREAMGEAETKTRAEAEAEIRATVDEEMRRRAESEAGMAAMEAATNKRGLLGERKPKPEPPAIMPLPAPTGSPAPGSGESGVSAPVAPPVQGTALPPAGAVAQTPAASSQLSLFPPEAPAAPTGFTTAKGSTYQVHPDGTTTRNKAARPEHPGEKERGPQPKSERTFYVTEADANKLSEHQAIGGPKRSIAEVPSMPGHIGVRYEEGKDKGKFEKRTVVAVQTAPAVGLLPVETWQGGRAVHFGNPITNLQPAAPPAVAPPPVPTPSPAPPAAPVSTGVAPAGGAAAQKVVPIEDDDAHANGVEYAKLGLGAGNFIEAKTTDGRALRLVNVQDNAGRGVVVAYDINGEHVGQLDYTTGAYQGTPEAHVSVAKAFRRSGIGTEMVRLASQTGGVMPPQEQPKTEAGHGFAAAVPGKLAPAAAPAPEPRAAPTEQATLELPEPTAKPQPLLTPMGTQPPAPAPAPEKKPKKKRAEAQTLTARMLHLTYPGLSVEEFQEAIDAGADPMEIARVLFPAAGGPGAKTSIFDTAALRELLRPLIPKQPAAGGPVPDPYASGMSRPGDMQAAIDSDVGVGVTITELSRKAMNQLVAAVEAGKHVFVDSGAFSAFRKAEREGREPVAADFEKIMEKYAEFVLKVIARIPDRRQRGLVSLVAPDVVGNQAESLQLLSEYAETVKKWLEDGFEVIVPIQSGPMSPRSVYSKVVNILDGNDFVVGIPSNAKALSDTELRNLLSAPIQPDRIHILGAVNSKRLDERMAVINDAYADSEQPGVTSDANLLRSKMDALRGLTGAARQAAAMAILNAAAPERKRAAKAAGARKTAEPEPEPTPEPTEEGEVTGIDEDVGAQAAGTTAGTDQTDTPQFRNWFGDSAVVDKNGDPKVMYHGNAHGEGGGFEIFDRMMSHTGYARRGVSMDTVGSWFSDSPEGGNLYAGSEGGAVYPVYLSIENPWHATWDEFIHKMHTTAGRDPKRQNPRGRGSTEELRAWLEANGYDGIVFPRQSFDGVMQQVWVALDPTQIKSASGNVGAFDPENPSILRDTGDSMQRRTSPEPEEPEVPERAGLAPTDPLSIIARRRRAQLARAEARKKTPPVAPKRNTKLGRSNFDAMWRDLLGMPEVGPQTPAKEQALRRIQGAPMPRQVKIARQRLTHYFGFKDITIDPKLTSREAMDVMLDAYNNLHTMAGVMTLPRQAMGFNGQITLNLAKSLGNKGTRGMFSWDYDKGFSASVLSLARRADSFTHEWFHALDLNLLMRYMAGSKDLGVSGAGNYTMKPLEKLPEPIRTAFTDVMRAIFLVNEESAIKMGDFTLQAAKTKHDLDKAQAALERTEALLRDEGNREERAKEFDEKRPAIAAKMRARTKRAQNEVAAQRAEVARLEKELAAINQGMLDLLNQKGTVFHHASRYVDKLSGQNYFALPAELLARAGESWMGNRIGQQVGTEFLSGSPDWYNNNTDGIMRLVYPNAAEREGIFKKIDALFRTLSSNQYFTGNTVAARIPSNTVFDNEVAQLALQDENVSAFRRSYNSLRNDFVKLLTAPIDLLRPSTWAQTKGVPTKIAGAVFRGGLAPTHLSVEETIGMLQIIHRNNDTLNTLLRKFKFMIGTNPGTGLPNQTAPAQERVDRLKNQWHSRIRHAVVDAYKLDVDNEEQMAALYEELARPTEQVRDELKEHKAFLEREIERNKDDANKRGQVGIMRDNLREIERRLRMTPPPATPSTNIQKAAAELRKLSDEMYYKAHDAKIDLGYVSNHVRRVLREDALETEEARTRFIERATLAYQATHELTQMRGERRLAELKKDEAKWEAVLKRVGRAPPPLAKTRKEIAELRQELAENAKLNPAEQALEYLEQIMFPDLFLADETTPRTKFTKQRVLAPAADLLLAEFYDQNPVEAMYAQASTVAARSVYADMFGNENQKLLDMRAALVDAGLDRKDLHFIDDAVRVAFGQTAVNHQGVLQAVPNWIMTLVTQRLLGNSIFSNLPEPMNVGKRTGNVVDSFRGLMYAYAPILARGNEREIVYTMEVMGLLADTALESVFADRYGTGKENGLHRRVQNRYGKVSLLNWGTRRSRISNYRVLGKFVQFQAFNLSEGTDIQKQEAINELNDLGVPENQREEFAAFMRALPKGGVITPPMMQAIDNYAMKDLYGAVMYRAIRQSTQLPQRTERARGGVGNSIIGRWTYAVTGFNRSYERNIVLANIKRIYNAPTWSRKGAHLIAYLTVSGVVAMVTMMVNETRKYWSHVMYDLLMGDDEEEEEEDEGITGKDIVNAFDRSGDTGRFTDLLNYWTRFKHQRDFSTVFSGAIPGWMADNMGRMIGGLLPGATDTAERRGVAALWDSTVGVAAAPLVTGRGATGVLGWMVMSQLQSRGLRDVVSETAIPKTRAELAREKSAQRSEKLERLGRKPDSDLRDERKEKREEILERLGR